MKNKIITVVSGDLPYWPKLRPFMEAYAEKVGADFQVLTRQNKNELHPKVPMLRGIKEWSKSADDQDRLLYLDADILIRKTAPNIFNLPGRGDANAWARPAVRTRGRGRRWVSAHYDTPCKGFVYHNAGVLMLDGSGARMCSEWLGPPYLLGIMDQHQVNAALFLSGVTINPLERAWNVFPKTMRSVMPSSRFIHFAGKSRDMIGKILKRMNHEDTD